MAIDERDGTTLEESGVLGTFEGFTESLALSDPCLIVTCNSAWILAKLQARWEQTPGWTSKATRRERTFYDARVSEYGVSVGLAHVVPHYCGWRRPPGRRYLTARYSYFLDPDLFYSSEKAVLDVFGPRDFAKRKLLGWAKAVRLFCQENDFPVRQTQGSLAAQFLTDKRFYPGPRRKVPKATNSRLRNYLPGNHAFVAVSTGRGHQFNGHYIDQRRAHHHHARTVALPDANSLYAYGDFARLKQISLSPGAFLDGTFHGCVAGSFTPPERGTKFLPPRWRRRTESRRMVSTAEWPWLADIGVTCTGLYAAWGSTAVDVGIPAYARFAESELDKWEARRSGAAWLKPVLVSTYGALAVNVDTPFDALVGGPLPKGYKRASWPVGDLNLHGYLMAHTEGSKVEPGCVNVLHRLMIESATRTESLMFANWLESKGLWVLMIHVDAVIVEEDLKGLSTHFPDPWRYKTRLTGLTFIDDVSFESFEMTRMPGRPLRSRKLVAVVPPRPFKVEHGLLDSVPDEFYSVPR